ncbi:cytochrome b561 isoform X2 [Cryptotermes secundus]|uniref:cytochrome b561 isoform X2 n=2 Tax=Cryptotermes secundus TaxID=105785 RepID=UPI001454D239|nr:cytochrome b561 isoform X2 [Cryptotermes secundus]
MVMTACCFIPECMKTESKKKSSSKRFQGICKGSGDMDAPQQNLEGFITTFGVAQAVGALTVILVTVWAGHYRGGFAWRSNVDLEFNWHPVLMTFGMIFLYANSIMIYRAFRNNRKRRLKVAHMLIHVIAFILVVIGLVAVFDSHNLKEPPIPNLYTLHSWIGLSAVILFACQWASGFVTFFFPGLQSPLRATYMPVHVFFGLAGFIAAVIAALLGLTEKVLWTLNTNYAKLPAEGILINFIGVLLVAFAGLVMYLVTEPRFKRQPLPEDEMLLTSGRE